jgi:very-short-patch-repair endonuclease
VDVTVPGYGGRCRREGIRTHRSLLEPEDVSTHRAIPVTTPARTVADLRNRLSPSNLRSVLRQAELRGLDVGPHFELEGTRSELERRFLALCRRHGLPQPQVNVPLDSYVVDFLWPEARLVVETDGYRFHHGRGSFEDDRARDIRLKLLGYEVLRVTWRQLRSDRPTLVATLRRLLRDAGAT